MLRVFIPAILPSSDQTALGPDLLLDMLCCSVLRLPVGVRLGPDHRTAPAPHTEYVSLGLLAQLRVHVTLFRLLINRHPSRPSVHRATFTTGLLVRRPQNC